MQTRHFIKTIASVVAATFVSLSNFSDAQEVGVASFYSTKTGKRTASGKPLKDTEYTAAHRTLRFGTKVKVTNMRNKKSIIVTITDRGPFVKGRVIDLTVAGAKALGFYDKGLDVVKVEVVKG
jgi:rare lipoprotein A